MIVRSRDHRCAGLWWSLPLSGGGLGGHGRLHKPFWSLIITFVPAGATVDYFCDKIHRDQWTKEVTSLPFIISYSSWCWFGRPWKISWSFRPLPHLPRHFAAAGAAADRFVIEFAVDRWVIRRGPLGNSPWTTGQRGGPATFIFSCSWSVLR